jgi:hypothetical protein
LGKQRATTRPRRRQPGTPAPRRRRPTPRVPPPRARGLAQGRLTHWSQPGGGTSSSGISTTAARGLPAAAGAGEVDGAATAVVVVTVMTVAAYNGSVAVTARSDSTAAAALHGPSLSAVAVLPAARDALDERRLVGIVASDLNTLAGARGARWASPYKHENEKFKLSLISKMRHTGDWSPTSGWRIPASSSSGARRTLWPRPAWPPPHPQPSLRRAPAPPRCASPLS